MSEGKRFDLAFETRQLIDMGKEIREGETWLYSDMSKKLGATYPYDGKGLYSARRILLRDFGIIFIAVKNVGLRRLDNKEKVGITGQAIETTQRLVRRTSKKLGTIDFMTLPDELRVEVNTGMTVLKVMEHATNRKTFERVRAVVNESKGILSVGRTMELFGEKK
jgi:hypothetical protein